MTTQMTTQYDLIAIGTGTGASALNVGLSSALSTVARK